MMWDKASASEVPLVSVVVPTWNGVDLLREFMPSVMALDYPNYEVIVVDNASTDGTVEFIEKHHPQVRVLRNSRNDGTAEGSNIGARTARGKYIFFISNDMWIDGAILSKMVPHMEEDEGIGICTVKMRRITANGDRLMEIDSVGADADMFGFPMPRGSDHVDDGQWDGFADVFFSFGGAMLIRRDVFEKTGGYDSAFFTLADDIDLSWRVRLLGYRVVVEPAAFLYHRVSATLNTPAFKRAYRRFISERNTIRMLMKNYRMATLAWLLPMDMFVLLLEMGFFVLKWRWDLVGADVRAVLWNIRHLSSTIAARRITQQMRMVRDRDVWRAMYRGVGKFWLFHYYLKHRDHPGCQDYFRR